MLNVKVERVAERIINLEPAGTTEPELGDCIPCRGVTQSPQRLDHVQEINLIMIQQCWGSGKCTVTTKLQSLQGPL